MNSGRCIRLMGLAAGLAVLALHADASVTLPFSTNFEGGVVIDGSTFSTNPSGEGVVTTQTPDSAGDGGTKSCLISNQWLALNMAASDNIWMQFYTKAAGYADQPISGDFSGSAVALYVETSGVVYARSGTDWTNLFSVSMTGNQSGWLGFLVHVDCLNAKWDLYTENTIGGGTFTRRNSQPLTFNSGFSPSTVTNFQIKSELTALVDTLSCLETLSPVDASALMATVEKQSITASTTVLKPLVIPNNSYSGADSTMGGALGRDMKAGLRSGDSIQIWTTNGYDTFTLDGGGAWSGGAALNYPLNPGDVVYVQYGASLAGGTAFLSPNLVPGDTTPPTVVNTTVTINGTETDARGWTFKSYSGNTDSTLALCNLGSLLPNQSAVYLNTVGGAYTKYFVVGGNFYKSGVNVGAATSLPKNKKMWIFKNSPNPADWTLP